MQTKSQRYWEQRYVRVKEKGIRRGETYEAALQRELRGMYRAMEQDMVKAYRRFRKTSLGKEAPLREIQDSWPNITGSLDTVSDDIYGQVGDKFKHSHFGSGKPSREKLMDYLLLQSSVKQSQRVTNLHEQLNKYAEAQGVKNIDSLESELIRQYANTYRDNRVVTAEYSGSDYVTNGAIELDRLNKRKIKQIINAPWSKDGKDFSKRVWGHYRDQLPEELMNVFAKHAILGTSPQAMIKEIRETFNGFSKNDVHRLVVTEISHVQNRATMDTYIDDGIESYEMMATLENRTCVVCAQLDGKRFKVTDAREGNNYPPIHPRCRCTTVPWLPEFGNDKPISRWYRDPTTGKGAWSDYQSFEDYKKNVLGKTTAKDKPATTDYRSLIKAGEAVYKDMFTDEVINKGQELDKACHEARSTRPKITGVTLEEYNRQVAKRNEAIRTTRLDKAKYWELLAKETISKHRELNNGSLAPNITARAMKANRVPVTNALNNLPIEWTKAVNQDGLTLKTGKRGYFMYGDGVEPNIICLSGDTIYRNKVAYHELGHAMEKTNPAIRQAESDFYDYRTAGEKLKPMRSIDKFSGYGKDEKTRVDNFLNPYMGKEYMGRDNSKTAFELLSMGIEGLYQGTLPMHKDKEFTSFILGVLTKL